MMTIIVAMTEDGLIGRDGSLPWHYHDDMVHFKTLTMGHALLMGANTYESLPSTKLPGRTLYVASTRRDYPGVTMVRDLAAFLASPPVDLWIIGGASLYRATLPFADALEVTWIHAPHDGNVRFPRVDWASYHLVREEKHDAILTFSRYERNE